jgi:flagellar basal body rod protein FlgG
MDQAQMTIAACMHELTRYQDAISNNLANINSTAFKRRAGTFEQVMMETQTGERTVVPGYREETDFEQGDFLRTDDRLNIALTGNGFLRVRAPGNPEQSFFTRSGALVTAANGTLMTRTGYEVLGANDAPITVGQGQEITIDERGGVTDARTGEPRGTLGIWRFEKPDTLRYLGLGLYGTTAQSGSGEADRTTTVIQGGLERSNVNSVLELVAMISVQRHYGAASRAMSALEANNEQLMQLARG